MIDYHMPVLGFCAYSGTGKTTLLTQLIPILKRRGLRIGMVKHAHHRFEIDHAGKDSFKLRRAGADQVLVASRSRIAWIKETPELREEPSLAEVLSRLEPGSLDLVLVEGFKLDPFPKIEIHRPHLGKPPLYPDMPWVIAVATDGPLDRDGCHPHLLNLNQPREIADFIERWLLVMDEPPLDAQPLGVFS